MPVLYLESADLFATLFSYCKQDVLAERALSAALPDLNLLETQVFLLDQTINARGFRLDSDAIDAALTLIDGECADLNAELAVLTGGAVEKATQRTRMTEWFATQGLEVEDTTKDTVEGLLNGIGISPPVRRALEIMQQTGLSSTAKYTKMQDWLAPDSRIHGGLLYHGASTGRWSGKGVQPHNFPKGNIKDQDALWDLLKSLDPPMITALAPLDKAGEPVYSTVMDALSQALRGVIVPSPGKQLYVADYAAIEARVLLWMAEDESGLNIFRKGEDIYCDMASSIYNRPITKADTDERALGKVAILGLGYQMGAAKFVDTVLAMAGITISEGLAKQTVDAYRAKYWRVKQLWRDTEDAAIDAVRMPGTVQRCGCVSYVMENGFLFCTLPSGRRLAYPEPEVHPRLMPWGDYKDSLTYMGIDIYTRQWKRQHTYGGSLVENGDQAIARDFLAAALLRVEASDTYQPILTVHDELIAEADMGAGSVNEFEVLLTTLPGWGFGCPIAAEAFSATRYRK